MFSQVTDLMETSKCISIVRTFLYIYNIVLEYY